MGKQRVVHSGSLCLVYIDFPRLLLFDIQKGDILVLDIYMTID